MNDGVDPLTRAARVAGWVRDLVPTPDIGAVVTALVGALLVLGCLLGVRELATWYALAPHRRVRYRVRATAAAEWSIEEMERWAAQLSRIRRRVRRFADRPAQAVRFRLESTPQGPAYTVEGSRLAEPILCDPLLSDVAVTRLRPRRHRGVRARRPARPGSQAARGGGMRMRAAPRRRT